ncbi:MAG: serine hydrolase domain-containing protein [Candidatus Kariarchaeaceae archaeon]|jgi:CubicO group peptidase (beta-lactamase class C family)
MIVSNFKNPKLLGPIIVLLITASILLYVLIDLRTDDTIWPTTGWTTSTPEEQGMHSEPLEEMMDVINEQNYFIDSIVVVKNGYIVWEYPDQTTNSATMYKLYSATKSFMSALIGIAIDKGILESVDQKVVDLFPERTIANLDVWKSQLTIEHLLTMTCGFEWVGPDFMTSSWGAALAAPDIIQHILDLPMSDDPGSAWYYNGGCSHLLSAILADTSGITTADFAEQYLFDPLGIESYEWPIDKNGYYFGGQDIYLYPRDMAKFGYLFLNEGEWDGKQIISKDWVQQSTNTSIFLSESVGYGYQWWTYPQSGTYFANGAFGQKIFVVPESDLVVVFNADIRNQDDNMILGNLLHAYIIPATQEQPSLPRCSKYGITFDCQAALYGSRFDWSTGIWYPEMEFGLLANGSIDYTGSIEPSNQAGYMIQEDAIGFFRIFWDTSSVEMDHNAIMNGYAEMLFGTQDQISLGGDINLNRSTHKAELHYYSREYSSGNGNVTVFSIAAIWYCDLSDRVFLISYTDWFLSIFEEEPLTSKIILFLQSFEDH